MDKIAAHMAGEVFTVDKPGKWSGQEQRLDLKCSVQGSDLCVQAEVGPSMIWVTLEGTNTLLGAHEFSKADLSGLARFSILSWTKNPADLNGRNVVPFAFYNEYGVWRGQKFTLNTGTSGAPVSEGTSINSGYKTSSSWKIENGKKITTTTKTYADGRTETSVSVEDTPIESVSPPPAPVSAPGVGTHVATKWRIEGGKKHISTTTTYSDGRTETVQTVEDAPHP
jgi:hypothetical protein